MLAVVCGESGTSVKELDEVVEDAGWSRRGRQQGLLSLFSLARGVFDASGARPKRVVERKARLTRELGWAGSCLRCQAADPHNANSHGPRVEFCALQIAGFTQPALANSSLSTPKLADNQEVCGNCRRVKRRDALQVAKAQHSRSAHCERRDTAAPRMVELKNPLCAIHCGCQKGTLCAQEGS